MIIIISIAADVSSINFGRLLHYCRKHYGDDLITNIILIVHVYADVGCWYPTYY